MALDFLSDFLNVDRGVILAPLAILMSACLGSLVAIWAIISNRNLAKLKNSMDFVNSYNEDRDISLAIKEIAKIENKTSHEVEDIATHNKGVFENAEHIMEVLNYYEGMALCIHRSIYGEKIIKEAVYTTVTDIWDICLPYVKERRKIKKKITYYQEMEALIGRWKASPLKTKTR